MLYLELFDESYLNSTSVSGIINPRDYQYVKKTASLNRDIIEKYYLTRAFAVKNTHLISMIIEHLPIMIESDDKTFMGILESRAEELSRTFSLTSGVESGSVHQPFFYEGDGSNNIIISDYSSITYKSVAKNWQKVSCLKAYTHSWNDFDCKLPYEVFNGKGGLSVVGLDIRILGIKYREFIKENMKSDKNSLDNKLVFVHKYVIPGILNSSMDHGLLNMIIDTFYKRKIIHSSNKYPFSLSNMDRQLDRFISDTLDNITNRPLSFNNILNNIKLVNHNSAADLLLLKGIPYTRHTRWALLASRLKYMNFLIDVSKDLGRNQLFINDWKLLIGRMERDQNLGEFNYMITSEMRSYMNKIKKI